MTDVSSNDSGAVSKLSPAELYGKRISLTTGGPLHREDAILMIDEIAALRAERDEWREAASEFEQERDDYWFQLEHMRPVVQRAEEWRDDQETYDQGPDLRTNLVDAVDAYRASVRADTQAGGA